MYPKILSWWQDLWPTKRGRYGAQKSSATDERIYISKQNYTGVPADQQKEALRKFHEENPNMFMPNEEPNHTIIPQVSTTLQPVRNAKLSQQRFLVMPVSSQLNQDKP